MDTFEAQIEIIGGNPFVLLPEAVLNHIFEQAQKNKGPIPVCGTIEGCDYIQTLVKYQGEWRLYINGPMIKASGKQVGDSTTIQIAFDPRERPTPMHPKLEAALNDSPAAQAAFDQLSPSRQKEIKRYINSLKSEDSVDKHVKRAIAFLLGEERFVGRDVL